jgi:hypothetical protein
MKAWKVILGIVFIVVPVAFMYIGRSLAVDTPTMTATAFTTTRAVVVITVPDTAGVDSIVVTDGADSTVIYKVVSTSVATRTAKATSATTIQDTLDALVDRNTYYFKVKTKAEGVTAWSADSAATVTMPPSLALTPITSTKMKVTIGLPDTSVVDSIIVVLASDSTTAVKVVAYNDSTRALKLSGSRTVIDTVTSLVPYTAYSWQAWVDSTGAGVVARSLASTDTTKFVALEPPLNPSLKTIAQWLLSKTAWYQDGTQTNLFTLVDATGRDSSAVYYSWPYDGMTLIAPEDSTVMRVRLMGGYTDNKAFWRFVPVDSLDIAAAGTYTKTWSIPVGCEHFYLQFLAQTGNGYDTDFYVRQRRDRW